MGIERFVEGDKSMDWKIYIIYFLVLLSNRCSLFLTTKLLSNLEMIRIMNKLEINHKSNE